MLALENEGCTTSDAQSAANFELEEMERLRSVHQGDPGWGRWQEMCKLWDGPPVITTEVIRSKVTLYVTASCGKTSALICVEKDGVRVICKNASHRVWRGSGRFFSSVALAVEAYRSPAMKAIILAAEKLNS